jgi:hypothetical protein
MQSPAARKYDAIYYENNKQKFKEYYLKKKESRCKMCETCNKAYVNINNHLKSNKHLLASDLEAMKKKI